MSAFVERLRICQPEDLGNFAERLWANIFKGAGLSYIPLCKIANGGAPMMNGGYRKLILPDFEVSSNRFTFLVDSKGKRRPVVYRNAGEVRHGVPKHSWEHYRIVAERSRKHCCLAIFECFADEHYEKWSGALLLRTLATLGEPFHGFGPMSDTVFWPRKRFVHIGNVEPSQLADLYHDRPGAPIFKDALWDLLELSDKPGIQMQLF